MMPGGILMLKKSMKILLGTALLLSAALPAFAFEDADPVLASLVSRAAESSPIVAAAGARTARAEAAISEAKAKFGPKIGVATAAIWAENDPLLPAVNPLTGSLLGVVPAGFRNTYAAAAGFVQTVYAGGSLYANKQAAVLARDAAAAEESRVLQSVANSVRVAYYGLRRAEEKELVAKEALTLSKNHLVRAEKLFKAGVAAKGDVLRTKVAVAESEMNLIRAQNAAALSIPALERAVGVSLDKKELETPRRSLPAKAPLYEISPDVQTVALENRAEIRMYSLLSKQADRVARAAQGQLLPQIMAVGALTNVDNEFFPNENGEWRLGLAAYWTIFDNGEISARTRQAKSKAKELLFMVDDMKNVVKMEATQAELNLKSAESRLVVAQRRLAEAEEDYRIAVKRYDANVGTNLDMLDARLSLTNSKTELVDSLYDIETARANLLFAIGKQ